MCKLLISLFSSFNKIFSSKILLYFISCLSILTVIFIFFKGLEDNIKSEKPIQGQISLFEFFIVIFVILTVIVLITIIMANYYKSKYEVKTLETIFTTEKLELLQNIRNKVLIGLENINNLHNADFQETKLLYGTTNPNSTLEFFPSEIKNEIQNEIKNKSIFTLIEIAYQDPTETNPTKLSKSLKIPPSTLSREIKKLISLNYLESYISDSVMQDTRFKNFKITEKGFILLMNLKNALNITINQIKVRNGEKSLYSDLN